MEVLSCISKLLVDTNYPSPIPEQLRLLRKEGFGTVTELLTKIAADRNNETYILVVTGNANVVDLIHALNENYESRKLSVCYNSQIDTSEIEDEIVDSCFTNSAGTLYYPIATELSGIYRTANGRVIVADTNPPGTLLYKNAEEVGVLLDEDYQFSNITRGFLNEIGISDKARLFIQLLTKSSNDDGRVPSFSDIVMVKGSRNLFIPISNSSNGKISVYAAYLTLFTGITSEMTFGDAIISLATIELPDTILDDVFRILTKQYVRPEAKLPSAAAMAISMKRVLAD